jgi:alkanesulfonate monooxygenase SsuD/methylene tetrahydromethanopterin reductase-like flavin-dependent oxidoreductase (luciferase family)
LREWINELAIVGTPEDCARAIHARFEAGADRDVFVTLIDRIEQQLQVLGTAILPLL